MSLDDFSLITTHIFENQTWLAGKSPNSMEVLIGKSLEHLWKIIGKSLEHNMIGKSLENHWKIIGNYTHDK